MEGGKSRGVEWSGGRREVQGENEREGIVDIRIMS
jgi:hypothetical protein